MQQPKTLSFARTDMRPAYDVVVVGSGYGGGLAAGASCEGVARTPQSVANVTTIIIVVFNDGNARIGRPKVDADNFSHVS